MHVKEVDFGCVGRKDGNNHLTCSDLTEVQCKQSYIYMYLTSSAMNLLTDLPTELLLHICHFLQSSHLRCIAPTNSRFKSAAAPSLFAALAINASNAQACARLIHQNSYAKHVRTLTVKDTDTEAVGDPDEDPTVLAEVHADHQRTQSTYAQDATWQAVASLIRNLPALTDLIWLCREQFPWSYPRDVDQVCTRPGPCQVHLFKAC